MSSRPSAGPSAGPSARASARSAARAAAAIAAALSCVAAPAYAAQAGPAPIGATPVAPDRLEPSADATTGAGSVVYVRGYDIYVANPDGSSERRLTTDGSADQPWFSPSEDDAGHVVAAHGRGASTHLVRMDQFGRVLSDFAPPVPSLSLGFARVSPAGDKVAYGSLFSRDSCDPSCGTDFQSAVQYTRATESAPVSTSQSDAVFATWAGDGRTILGTKAQNTVLYHDLTRAQAGDWIDDCLDYEDGCNDTNLLHFQPTVSRQGDRYASVFEVSPWSGSPQEYLLMRPTADALTGQPPTVPHDGCVFGPFDLSTPFPTEDDQQLAMPSWSPDGRSVVVAVRDETQAWSVYRLDVPDLDDCGSITGEEIAPGASQPFWSPAALSTQPPPPPPATELTYDGARPGLAGKPRVGKRLHLSMKPAALKNGFSPAAEKVTFQWLRDGAPVDGATGVRHKVVKADRHHKLSVLVTGLRSGCTPGQVQTKAVKVR